MQLPFLGAGREEGGQRRAEAQEAKPLSQGLLGTGPASLSPQPRTIGDRAASDGRHPASVIIFKFTGSQT